MHNNFSSLLETWLVTFVILELLFQFISGNGQYIIHFLQATGEIYSISPAHICTWFGCSYIIRL